jgi:phosphoglycolate phosphatase-like HAD superfamily hydrolase
MIDTPPVPHGLFLFDIDGTLIHAGQAGLLAFQRAVREVLGEVSWPAELRFDGRTDPWIAKETLRLLGAEPSSEPTRLALLEAYVAHLPGEVARSTRFEVLPGVDRVLSLLEQGGAAIGLATGNLKIGARIKLERPDLWRRFSFGGFGCDHEDRAELTRQGLARGRAHASSARLRAAATTAQFVVGDTPRDVAAALATGATPIGVMTGSFSFEELRGAGAYHVYEDLHQLAETMERSLD